MATENIVTGKKYRILKDATNKIWDVISFWTKASDVYNNNNQNLQTTVGGITGISSSLTSTSSSIAASANAVKQLNDKITQLNSDIGVSKITYFDTIHTYTFTLDYVPDGVFLYYPDNDIPAFYWLDNKYKIEIGLRGYNGDTSFSGSIVIEGNTIKVRGDSKPVRKFIAYKY